MALFVFVHQVFEPDGPLGMRIPVVEHRFYGDSPEACTRLYESHRKTDYFLRDCTDKGQWKQGKCETRVWIQQFEL